MVLFGKSSSLRRIFPMLRVDYIRVSGTQWVADPDERYSTIDMRGPLLTLVFRIVDAVYGDLPKGFKLEDGLQAGSTGMPVKVLREAIINALMHRSYRVSSPIQVIRYDNRLEIINPGFSLKSEEMLGTPSSETRNPFIAAVFHETNLAETKGSGIRAMKKMLAAAELAPPTFNSSRTNNQFTARLLLHHFLNSSDLKWLAKFEKYELNDSQKRAIIFLRETGAIDNRVYRQLSDTDTITSTIDLRQLRGHNLITQKGKGRYTYYRPTDYLLNTEPQDLNTEPLELNTEPQDLSTEPQELSTEPQELSIEPQELNTEPDNTESYIISDDLKEEILSLKARERDSEKIKKIIVQLCKDQELSISEIASILNKEENWISRTYVKPLLNENRLEYKFPLMINHPEQAYKAPESD